MRDGTIPSNPAHKIKWRPNKPVKPPFSFEVVSGVGAAMRELAVVRKAWMRVAKRAGLSGTTIHGLQHWFASAGAEMNYSELVIAGLLGHSAGTVTGRYATTPDSALVAAADAISARLAEALDKSKRRPMPRATT